MHKGEACAGVAAALARGPARADRPSSIPAASSWRVGARGRAGRGCTRRRARPRADRGPRTAAAAVRGASCIGRRPLAAGAAAAAAAARPRQPRRAARRPQRAAAPPSPAARLAGGRRSQTWIAGPLRSRPRARAGAGRGRAPIGARRAPPQRPPAAARPPPRRPRGRATTRHAARPARRERFPSHATPVPLLRRSASTPRARRRSCTSSNWARS